MAFTMAMTVAVRVSRARLLLAAALVCAASASSPTPPATAPSGTGSVAFDNRSAIIDGRRKLMLSGAVHYARVMPGDWDRVLGMAKDMGPGKTIVTVLADYGTRYQSKLFNPDFLREKNLPVPDWMTHTPASIPGVFEDV